MNLYSLALFAHVCGVIGIFAGMGVWVFGIGALRHSQRVEQARLLTTLITASSNLVVGSIVLVGVAGFYMAITVWGIQTTWIIVATVSFILLAPIGLLVIEPRVRAIAKQARDIPDGPLPQTLAVRVHDPSLGVGLSIYIAVLLDIVFLMTYKPPTDIALLTVAAAVALGTLASVPLWRAPKSARAMRQPG
jgi:hypothetical protein